MSEPLTADELSQLATYNEECARGIVHNLQWVMRMQELQERMDEEWTMPEAKNQ